MMRHNHPFVTVWRPCIIYSKNITWLVQYPRLTSCPRGGIIINFKVIGHIFIMIWWSNFNIMVISFNINYYFSFRVGTLCFQ